MEQNIVTYEELHSIINILVQKVEALESSIKSIASQSPDDELMDTKGLRNYLKKSKSTIYRIINKREVSYIKQGNQAYFKKSDIDKWLEDNKREDNATTLRDVEELMKAKQLRLQEAENSLFMTHINEKISIFAVEI